MIYLHRGWVATSSHRCDAQATSRWVTRLAWVPFARSTKTAVMLFLPVPHISRSKAREKHPVGAVSPDLVQPPGLVGSLDLVDDPASVRRQEAEGG